MNANLILASASPRRRELLSNIGLEFTVVPAVGDEIVLSGELPEPAAKRLAVQKALNISTKWPDHYVLAADTIVAVDGEILGKPSSNEHAKQMLSLLSGREHIVITGFAIFCESTGLKIIDAVSSHVTFRHMSDDEINAYVQTGEVLDKAGAYAVQGIGACFVSSIVGSFSNVIGLPMAEVTVALRECGVWLPSMLGVASQRSCSL